MDERHWWIAARINNTLYNSNDNISNLEPVFLDSDNLNIINSFLDEDLFIYLYFAKSIKDDSKPVFVSTDIKAIQNRSLFRGDEINILLIMKQKNTNKISLANFVNELFCIELKEKSVMGNITTIMTQGLMPLLLDKYAMSDSRMTNLSNQLMNLWNSLRQHTENISLQNNTDEPIKATMDLNFELHDQLRVYENFVSEVIIEIESILTEVNERSSEQDIFLPGETEKWTRRHQILQNLVNQLKYKIFKNAIGFLVSKKSKLIKKWRQLEINITETLNMSRDKMKYLEAFKFEMEYLERLNADPAVLLYLVPKMFRKMKQMESASRHFAKMGYTGSVLSMIRRQILNIIDNKIAHIIHHDDTNDNIWKILLSEAADESLLQFITMDYSYIRGLVPKEQDIANIDKVGSILSKAGVISNKIIGVLKLLSILYDLLSDQIGHLRDIINLSSTANTTMMLANILTSPAAGGTREGTGSEIMKSTGPPDYFIKLHDSEAIFGNWTVLNNEIKKFLDIFHALLRFNLIGQSKIATHLSVTYCDVMFQFDSLLRGNHRKPRMLDSSLNTSMQYKTEDEEVSDNSEEGVFEANSPTNIVTSKVVLEWLLDIGTENKNDIDLFSIISRFKQHLEDNLMNNFELKQILRLHRSKMTDSLNIDKAYSIYEEDMENFDKIFTTFLKFIFLKKLKTDEILSILSKLDHLKFRRSLKGVISHKFSELFVNFRNDIAEVAADFQAFKKEPIQIVGLPPIVNALTWSQKMISSLEIPMLRFQDNKEITELREYEPTVRIYNKTTKKLMEYKTAYINYWLSSVEHCVGKLRAPLLLIDSKQLSVQVNIPDNVISLINETRYLVRMDKTEPHRGVTELLKSEKRLKSFYSKLNDVVGYFKKIKDSIPANLMFLFPNLLHYLLQVFQPGSTTLTWSSVNIDVFLHKAATAVAECQRIIGRVVENEQFIQETFQMIQRRRAVNFGKILKELWNHQKFLTQIKEDVIESRDTLKTTLFECKIRIDDICNMIFDEEKRKTQPNLFEGEQDIRAAAKDRYNGMLKGSMMQCIVNNMIYLAKCTSCSIDIIRTFLCESNMAECDLFSNDDELCDKWGEQVFCKNDLQIIFQPQNDADADTSTNDNLNESLLKFIVYIKYEIPVIKVDPKLEDIQESITETTRDIIELFNNLSDFNGRTVDLENCPEMGPLQDLALNIAANFENYETSLNNETEKLKEFEFLWKMNTEQLSIEDCSLMQSNKYELVKDKIRHILRLKSYLKDLPKEINKNCIILSTVIFKEVLLSLLNNWQNSHGQKLHEEAKMLLEDVTRYRKDVSLELNRNIDQLEQLNEILAILDKIFDLDLKIDSVYQPIEAMYNDLELFDLPIPRGEAEELENLRRYWTELMSQAEDQRQLLLKEKRNEFHQELDKQLKKFTVEIIKFRNLFDYECPGMAGSDPIEVEEKLEQFQHQYSIYEAKRDILVKISRLFGLRIQSFHELESMEEDLNLLTQLYSLYQKYSNFEKQFHETLWSSIDLEHIFLKLTEFWDECLALPSKLKEKESYGELKMKIDYLIKLHSILVSLAAKEIRNRHWLRVMQVCGVTFQLEASTFYCKDLTDINLLEHKEEIQLICYDARKEMELEVKLHLIEEEWTEQVLVLCVDERTGRGPVLLDQTYTNWLLQQLENSQLILDEMFSSQPQHIDPMRDEAALWAAKLLEIGEVLELWLQVQTLWCDLEAVFRHPAISKELSAESKRFDRLDRSYVKSMKRVNETKNVFQCCISNEYSKKSFLKNIQQGLENCFDGLRGFLHKHRDQFHRLWFLPDSTILSLLNSGIKDEKLKSFLPLLFTSISDFETSENPKSNQIEIVKIRSSTNDELELTNKITVKDNVIHWLSALTNEIKESLIDITVDAIDFLQSTENLEDLVKKFPSQICCAVLQAYWSNEIGLAIQDLKNEKKAVILLLRKFNTQVSKIPAVLNKATWRNEDVFTPTHRIRLRALTLCALYLRDSLLNLSTKKLKEGDDFEYVKLVKVVAVPQEGDVKTRFQLSILNTKLELGHEFIGSLPTVAWTPITERAVSALLMSSERNWCSTIGGPRYCGKSLLTTECARQRHEYLATVACHGNMSHDYLVNFFCGVASNGCWGVLDNFDLLNDKHLSLVMSMIDQLISALRSQSDTVNIMDKHEIPLVPTSKLVLVTTATDVKLNKIIPSNLKQMFRNVTLCEPKYSEIIKWYSTALSFRAPRVLSMRLTALLEDGGNIIDQEGSKVITIKSIYSALNKAAEMKKVRYVKEKTNASDSGGQMPQSTLLEFWPSNPEKRAKSGQPSFIKQKSIVEPPPQISAAAKMEHGLVVECLTELLLPKLNPSNERLFKDILKNSFQTYSESYSRNLKESLPQDLLSAIHRECKSRRYPLSGGVVEKYAQLYHVIKFNQSTILCGQTFTGKSSALSLLLSAMDYVHDHQPVQQRESTSISNDFISASLSTHDLVISKDDNPSEIMSANNIHADLMNQSNHLYTLYPAVLENESDLFAVWSANNENNIDGLFTYYWRKANRNDLNSWITFDGPVDDNWSTNLHSILDQSSTQNKGLMLPNGESVSQVKNVKLIFELESANHISPGILSRSGLVHFSDNLITWKDIKMGFLDNRNSREIAALSRIFDKVMEPISQYLLDNHKDITSNLLTSIFQTSLKLLNQILTENKEIVNELHIQRLFVFSFIWCLDSSIAHLSKQSITNLLKKETSVLPDDDSSINLFDYFVDESGEWDLWSTKLLPSNEDGSNDDSSLIGENLIDTVGTLRCRLFLDIGLRAGMHPLLVGAKGSGKSLLLDNYWRKSDLSSVNVVRYVYSNITKSYQLKHFIDCNIEHKHGLVYGGKESKHLSLIIEDINLPYKHDSEAGIRKPNEVLRQLLDNGVLQNTKYPYEQIKLSDYNVVATMATDADRFSLVENSRLLRNFLLLKMKPPTSGNEITAVIQGIFECHNCRSSGANQNRPLFTIDDSQRLINATKLLYETTVNVLHQSDSIPGRYHCGFTLKVVRDMIMGLDTFPSTDPGEGGVELLEFWCYLAKRIYQDSLVLDIDIKWFNDKLKEVAANIWDINAKENCINVNKSFTVLPLAGQSSRSTTGVVGKSHSYQDTVTQSIPIDNLDNVRQFVCEQINQYNTFESSNNNQLPISALLSDNFMEILMHVYRQIEQHTYGHVIVVGSIGCHLSQICRLALHISQIPLQPVDTSSDTAFIDSMKIILRMVGSEGKQAALLLTARDLTSDLILDTLNSLLISGDCPSLFPPDELAGLLSAISFSLRRDKAASSSSSILSNLDLLELFRSRIRSNLHILLCLPPRNQIIETSMKRFPGILSNSRVIWIKDSAVEYLKDDALFFVNNQLEEIDKYINKKESEEKRNQSENSENIREQLVDFITSIHQEVQWLGGRIKNYGVGSVGSGRNMKLGKIIQNDKKKEIYKYDSAPYAPYGQGFLRDVMKQLKSPPEPEIYYGPCTFHRFLYILRQLLHHKTIERIQSTNSINRALNSITQTRSDITMITQLIQQRQTEYQNISSTSSILLKKLIDKITILTMITAKRGESAYLDDLLHKSVGIEITSSSEVDPLLLETDKDDLDLEFEKLREENLKNRKAIVKEMLDKTRLEYQSLKNDLNYSIEQVNYWKHKIDRSVIDRIKSFTNPPSLVVDVIEMVFVLIGKHISPSIRYDTGLMEDVESHEEKNDSKMRWKRMTQFITDPAKFVDILHNISWNDGLDSEIYSEVKSYLAVTKEPQLGITGEGTLLSQAENVNIQAKKGRITTNAGSDVNTSMTSKVPDSSSSTNKNISVAATKYASEDAALLVQYTVALVEYTEKCGPLKQALQKINELEIEIEESEGNNEQGSVDNETQKDYQTLDISDDFMEKLKLECDLLEKEYNEMIGERFVVATELQALMERLEMTRWLDKNIGKMEENWRAQAINYNNNGIILVKCLISAAYLSYCGPMDFKSRSEFLQKSMELARKTKLLPSSNWKSFTRMDVSYFLCNEIEISHQLSPMNSTNIEDAVDNACFLFTGETLLRNWPLVCDRSRRVVSWLNRLHNNNNVVTVPHRDLHITRLEGYLSTGSILIVTDCDTELLAKDEAMRQLLRNQYRFMEESRPFKLQLLNSHNEIECNPNFRLYLHATIPPNEVPNTLIASTFLISFNNSKSILLNEFLNRFIIKAKPSIESERLNIIREKEKMQKKLYKLEQQILDDLSNNIRLVKNNDHCKKIIRYLKLYDEIDLNLQQKEFIHQANTKSMENYQEISGRFAICFEMATKMQKFQEDYKVDFDKYTTLFDTLLESSERLSNKSILEKVTKKTAQYSMLSMDNQHKFIFCFQLAKEIERSLDHIDGVPDDYFVCPMDAAKRINPDFVKQNEAKTSNVKKPFEWMNEDQLMNVKVLGSCIKYFKDVLDNMYKESKEQLWRSIFESDSPEWTNSADKLFKYNINNYQKLCLLRTLRPDRVHQICHWFVQVVLNLKYKGNLTPSDVRLALISAPEHAAILVKYDTDSDDVTSLLSQVQLSTEPILMNLRVNDLSKKSLQRFYGQFQASLTEIHAEYDRVMSGNHYHHANHQKQHQPSSSSSPSSSVSNKNAAVVAFIIIHLSNDDQLLSIQNRISTIYQNRMNILDHSEFAPIRSSQDAYNNLSIKVFYSISNKSCQSNVTNKTNELVHLNINFPMGIRDSTLYTLKLGLNYLLQSNVGNALQITADLVPLLHNMALLLSIMRTRSTNPYISFHQAGSIRDVISPPSIIMELIDLISKEWFVIGRPYPWQLLRHHLAVSVIGGSISNEYDRMTVKSIVDFWLNSNAIRKEFEFPKVKYHIPPILFTNSPKLADVKKAFQNVSPFIFETPESYHLNSTGFTRTNNEKEMIEKVKMAETLFQDQKLNCNEIDLSKVENDLFDLTRLLFNKSPRNSVAVIQEKRKRVANNATYSQLIMRELTSYSEVFGDVDKFIQKIRREIMTEPRSNLTQDDYMITWQLLNNQIPNDWLDTMNKVTKISNKNSISPADWLATLQTKYNHLEKLITTPKDKVLCYNISSFQNPLALLALLRQEAAQHFMKLDRSGSYKEVKYSMEFINRDKDHLREPPSDGVYIYGLHLWGCGFDKTSFELTDSYVKNAFTTLPVVHLTFSTNEHDKPDPPDQFLCPIFNDSSSKGSPLFSVNLLKDGVSPSKWILRGVFMTVNPV